MALINQFQTYSQGENTVTNNVLLMLSSLYEINPKYYEAYVRGITEDSNQYEVSPSFLQQVNNNGDGIIDGHIQIKASRIIIETKLHATEWIDKLVKYSKSFEDNEYKILFHLSSSKYSPKDIEQIKQKIESKTVNFYSITYQEMVDQLKEVARTFPYEAYLQRLNDHFDSYCSTMGLILPSHILRAMACGGSFDLNKKYQFYFDPAERRYSSFNYLGIYRWKSVRYIGSVENNIVADWDEETGLLIKESSSEVTAEQSQRLTNAIKESMEYEWYINKGHRFFLLKDFYETDFNKTSPGGVLRVRYLNLEDYLEPFPKDLKEVAEKLKSKSWE